MTILKAQLGMTQIRANYRKMYDSITCEVCNTEDETLGHLLKCNNKNLDEADIHNYILNIENIENTDTNTIKNEAILIANSILVRASALEASPPHCASFEDAEDGDIYQMMDTS